MKKLFWTLLTVLFLAALPVTNGLATTFHIDPLNGDDSQDGSASRPWKSLQALFDRGAIASRNWDSLPYSDTAVLVNINQSGPIKAGDTILLSTGNYGELSISGYYNSSPITIAAKDGHKPLFSNIGLRSSSNWVLRGLHVNPKEAGPTDAVNLISLESHGYRGPVRLVTVTECSVASTYDSDTWTKVDWNTKAKNGIRVDGTQMQISNNSFTNVNFGISVSASHSLVKNNKVINFAGDGMRGLGDYTTFEGNIVKNAYGVNDNHDDGFQSWSRGSDGKVGSGVVRGIVLRGNTFINYEKLNQPFRTTLQGIGCFDGMFEDWLVENNIVKVEHWHGISLYGAVNSTIRSNIVIGLDSGINIGPPWIRINTHKDGTPSTGSTISCNISPKVIVSEGQDVTVEHNTLNNNGYPWHPACSSHPGRPAYGHPSILLHTPLLLNQQGREESGR